MCQFLGSPHSNGTFIGESGFELGAPCPHIPGACPENGCDLESSCMNTWNLDNIDGSGMSWNGVLSGSATDPIEVVFTFNNIDTVIDFSWGLYNLVQASVDPNIWVANVVFYKPGLGDDAIGFSATPATDFLVEFDCGAIEINDIPMREPTREPTKPDDPPTRDPDGEPTKPDNTPTRDPDGEPTKEPAKQPTKPDDPPTRDPDGEPTKPDDTPTRDPDGEPTKEPSKGSTKPDDPPTRDPTSRT